MEHAQGGSPKTSPAVPPASGTQFPETTNTKHKLQNKVIKLDYETNITKPNYKTECSNQTIPNRHTKSNYKPINAKHTYSIK